MLCPILFHLPDYSYLSGLILLLLQQTGIFPIGHLIKELKAGADAIICPVMFFRASRDLNTF